MIKYDYRIKNTSKNLGSKRVDIVSIKMIKESSMFYRNRSNAASIIESHIIQAETLLLP
ncbi:hypothetical protein IAI10_06165 [Clostridium sp. 19966]|uniref:hypothetical protein n=1 Tax=Clostridium sp. 19966 TaxID=2768166 RepID=UPI0028DD8C3E|nr:hypothetical protein [Clostridium sp. 19966]MDT8716235.1 hypothetical protein [Clostridium sp. 19966]